MPIKTPFFPELRKLTGGRKPASSLEKLSHYLEELKRTSVNRLESIFRDLIRAEIFDKKSHRKRIYTPRVTFWTFLNQVLKEQNQTGSLRTGLHEVSARLNKDESISMNTGCLCRARQRLDTDLLKTILTRVKERVLLTADKQILGTPRRVKAVDACHIYLPDTDKNQKRFPQFSSCKTGCSYPVARITGLIDLSSGAVCDYEIDSRHTSELKVFHNQLIKRLQEHDIIVGDRAYCSYGLIAQLKERNVDSIFRLPVGTNRKMSEIKRLSKGDTLVRIKKPEQDKRYSYIAPNTWKSFPKYQFLRRITTSILDRKGKTQKLVILTSLLDPEEFPAQLIINLYAKRWKIELSFREIKDSIGMRKLTCKTPQMIEKEVIMYFIGYNLIRLLMLQAAELHNLQLEKVSFKSTLYAMHEYSNQLYHKRMHIHSWQSLYDSMLENIAKDKLNIRPNRSEPRTVKYIRQKYDKMSCGRGMFDAKKIA